jgi:hypothetical protein
VTVENELLVSTNETFFLPFVQEIGGSLGLLLAMQLSFLLDALSLVVSAPFCLNFDVAEGGFSEEIGGNFSRLLAMQLPFLLDVLDLTVNVSLCLNVGIAADEFPEPIDGSWSLLLML